MQTEPESIETPTGLGKTGPGKTVPCSDRADWWFPQVWALCFCCLIAVTFRLWTGTEDVPAVAMADWAAAWPVPLRWLPLLGMLGGAVLVLAKPIAFRWGWWLMAGGLTLSFVIDQHRLQPWAYQTAIYGCVFATMHWTTARRWLIPLAASVYIYSAAGKLDYQFVHSVGQDFLDVLLRPLGLSETFSDATRIRLSGLFPVVELVAGLLLLPRVTRKYAGWAVIAIHVSLIGILGPWGLNHSLGVLVWNAALLTQAWFLFIAPRRNSARPPNRSRWIATTVVCLALVAPLSERAGWWDHWTSWALYSPHNSRAVVELHRSSFDSLPPAVRNHLAADKDSVWQELRLDEWSLESLSVPVYPQSRYQLALAIELAERFDIDPSAIRCRLRSASDRMDGSRQEKPLLGLNEIKAAMKDYWLVDES